MRNKLTIAIILVASAISAQNVAWEQTYSNYLVLGKMITKDSQNNIISVGNGGSVTAYNDYLYVQKHSSSGTLIWKDSIPTTTPSNYHSATWVGTDSNDNIIVSGYRFILSSQNEFPNAIKVLKFDPDGNLIYNNTVPGVFGSGSVTGMGKRNWAAMDEDDNLYVAAVGITDTLPQAGFLLLKFNSSGDLVWERVKTFSNIHALRGMHYRNGKIALIGKSTVSDQTNSVAVWDANGVLLWDQDNSTTNQTWGTDIALDNDGNTYTLTQEFGSGSFGLGLHKMNAQGDPMFSEFYDFPVEMTSGRLGILPNGSIVLAGTNWSSGGQGTLEVLKVSSQDGSIQYSHSSNLPQVTNWVYDLKVTSQGNYYVAGQSTNNGGAPSKMFLYAFSNANGYEWDTEYDNFGTEPYALMIDDNEDVYTIIHNRFTVVKFDNSIVLGLGDNNTAVLNVYPNPVRETLHLNVPPSMEISQIQLFARTGQLVGTFESHLNTIDLSALRSGLYFLVVSQKNGNNFRTKILKQ